MHSNSSEVIEKVFVTIIHAKRKLARLIYVSQKLVADLEWFTYADASNDAGSFLFNRKTLLRILRLAALIRTT